MENMKLWTEKWAQQSKIFRLLKMSTKLHKIFVVVSIDGFIYLFFVLFSHAIEVSSVDGNNWPVKWKKRNKIESNEHFDSHDQFNCQCVLFVIWPSNWNFQIFIFFPFLFFICFQWHSIVRIRNRCSLSRSRCAFIQFFLASPKAIQFSMFEFKSNGFDGFGLFSVCFSFLLLSTMNFLFGIARHIKNGLKQ